MVTALDIKEFIQNEYYQKLFLSLKNRLPIINFIDDDMQMYNIFAKMINNANLDLNDLIPIDDWEEILAYGKVRMLSEIDGGDDFLDGYESDEQPHLISYSYNKSILIQIMIEYFFLSKNRKDEFLNFFKKQRIPYPSKFLSQLSNIYVKSKEII